MDPFNRDARLNKVAGDVTFQQDTPNTSNTTGYSHPGMEQFGPRGQQVLEDAVRMRLGLIRPQQAPMVAAPPPGPRMPQLGPDGRPVYPPQPAPAMLEALRQMLQGQ